MEGKRTPDEGLLALSCDVKECGALLPHPAIKFELGVDLQVNLPHRSRVLLSRRENSVKSPFETVRSMGKSGVGRQCDSGVVDLR